MTLAVKGILLLSELLALEKIPKLGDTAAVQNDFILLVASSVQQVCPDFSPGREWRNNMYHLP